MKRACLFFLTLILCGSVHSALVLEGDDEAIRLLKPYLPTNAKRSQYRILANDILATEGYFSPTITFKRQGDRDLKMTVTLGKRVKVALAMIEIVDENNRSMTEDEKAPFLKDWALKEGTYFRQDLWSSGKQAILSALISRHWADAKLVNSFADVSLEDSSVRLYLVYETGPKYKMGEMTVEGLYRYSPKVVERYHTTLLKNEPYNVNAITNFQNALQSSPYFGNARITIHQENATDILDENGKPTGQKILPFSLKVTERPAHIFGAGIGYSTNTGTRVEGQYTTANFLNQALALESALRLEEKQQAIMADVFFLPRPNQHQMGVGTIIENSRIEGLKILRYAAGVQDVWTKNNIERKLSITWQKERWRASSSGLVHHAHALAPGFQWTWRKPQALFHGFVFQVNADVASKNFASKQDFARLYLRGQHFLNVSAKNQLILRYDLGRTFSKSKEGVPQEYLFRTGGTGSIRGYTYKSLGAKEGTATIGAKNLTVASAEWIHWLTDQWGVAAFVDTGNAWDNKIDLHTGAGFGARWKSPAGPLGIDLAYGFKEKDIELHFALNIPF